MLGNESIGASVVGADVLCSCGKASHRLTDVSRCSEVQREDELQGFVAGGDGQSGPGGAHSDPDTSLVAG
jgi:hypothetical protein